MFRAMIRGINLRTSGVYLVLLAGGWLMGQHFTSFAEMESRSMGEPAVQAFMMGAMSAFILTSALPFVPGAEIGLWLLVVFGSQVAPYVYLSMVLALSLAFCVGRFVPVRLIAPALRWIGLRRAAELLTTLNALPARARLPHLMQIAPNRVVPFLLRHRYMALVIVLNIPGNMLIGGGGGICFAAGLSRLYSIPAFLLTIMLAVLPVPLIFYLL